MHINRLHVRNFRAIDTIDLRDLKDLVVIAGPNGCGKSCIFDALRLLKSIYGGYQQNEYLQWFGEFQIDVGSEQRDFSSIFRDPARPVKIKARISLAKSEREFLEANVRRFAEDLAWAEVLHQATNETQETAQALAMRHPNLAAQVVAIAETRQTEVLEDLKESFYDLELTIERPDSLLSITPSRIANLVFRTYSPDQLGILDYHGAARNYAREGASGVTLDLNHFKTQQRNVALYNWQSKYGNIKNEIISSYVGQLIRREASATRPDDHTLDDTLAEMFRTFFPDKEYMGVTPQPDGKLAFPVRLKSGYQHDLNELSSGEKEVMYGYLRLKNQTPRNSTILLNEPELHLNPALLRGFPQFYYRHLVEPTGNQIWMATHSDTLLREAVGDERFSVYHMTPATTGKPAENQITPLARDGVQRALIDLVGDLAAYRPASRVIIFEGGGDSEFDVRVVNRLFPSLRDHATLISGGSKSRVTELYRVLSETASQTGVSDRFFAITDRDAGDQSRDQGTGHVFAWDVYHIENYLLSPRHLYQVYATAASSPAFRSEDDVRLALRLAAESLVDRLVSIELRDRIDNRLYRCVSIAGNPNSPDAIAELLPSIEGTRGRLREALVELADESTLRAWEAEIRQSRLTQLSADTWMQMFPGRDMLREFTREHFRGIMHYEGVVNSILTAMSAEGYQPPGMKKVLNAVMGAGQ